MRNDCSTKREKQRTIRLVTSERSSSIVEWMATLATFLRNAGYPLLGGPRAGAKCPLRCFVRSGFDERAEWRMLFLFHPRDSQVITQRNIQ